MNILRNIEVPTGNIMIVKGEKGKLEVLSLGDYGRTENVKAQFLGLNRDIDGVSNGECMPLKKSGLLLYLLNTDVIVHVNFVMFQKLEEG